MPPKRKASVASGAKATKSARITPGSTSITAKALANHPKDDETWRVVFSPPVTRSRKATKEKEASRKNKKDAPVTKGQSGSQKSAASTRAVPAVPKTAPPSRVGNDEDDNRYVFPARPARATKHTKDKKKRVILGVLCVMVVVGLLFLQRVTTGLSSPSAGINGKQSAKPREYRYNKGTVGAKNIYGSVNFFFLGSKKPAKTDQPSKGRLKSLLNYVKKVLLPKDSKKLDPIEHIERIKTKNSAEAHTNSRKNLVAAEKHKVKIMKAKAPPKSGRDGHSYLHSSVTDKDSNPINIEKKENGKEEETKPAPKMEKVNPKPKPYPKAKSLPEKVEKKEPPKPKPQVPMPIIDHHGIIKGDVAGVWRGSRVTTSTAVVGGVQLTSPWRHHYNSPLSQAIGFLRHAAPPVNRLFTTHSQREKPNSVIKSNNPRKQLMKSTNEQGKEDDLTFYDDLDHFSFAGNRGTVTVIFKNGAQLNQFRLYHPMEDTMHAPKDFRVLGWEKNPVERVWRKEGLKPVVLGHFRYAADVKGVTDQGLLFTRMGATYSELQTFDLLRRGSSSLFRAVTLEVITNYDPNSHDVIAGKEPGGWTNIYRFQVIGEERIDLVARKIVP